MCARDADQRPHSWPNQSETVFVIAQAFTVCYMREAWRQTDASLPSRWRVFASRRSALQQACAGAAPASRQAHLPLLHAAAATTCATLSSACRAGGGSSAGGRAVATTPQQSARAPKQPTHKPGQSCHHRGTPAGTHMTAMGFLACCCCTPSATGAGGCGCSTVQSPTSPTAASDASSDAVCRSASVSAAPAAVCGGACTRGGGTQQTGGCSRPRVGMLAAAAPAGVYGRTRAARRQANRHTTPRQQHSKQVQPARAATSSSRCCCSSPI